MSDPDYAQGFGKFISTIAKLAGAAGWNRVRELEQFKNCVEAPPGSSVHKTENLPGAIITIDVEGYISTFSPELVGGADSRYNDFRWGNVHYDSWTFLQEDKGFLKAADDIKSGIDACRQSCHYFALCGGGTPSNKLSELGTFAGTETAHCRAKIKALTDALLPLKEAELIEATSKGDLQP